MNQNIVVNQNEFVDNYEKLLYEFLESFFVDSYNISLNLSIPLTHRPTHLNNPIFIGNNRTLIIKGGKGVLINCNKAKIYEMNKNHQNLAKGLVINTIGIAHESTIPISGIYPRKLITETYPIYSIDRENNIENILINKKHIVITPSSNPPITENDFNELFWHNFKNSSFFDLFKSFDVDQAIVEKQPDLFLIPNNANINQIRDELIKINQNIQSTINTYITEIVSRLNFFYNKHMGLNPAVTIVSNKIRQIGGKYINDKINMNVKNQMGGYNFLNLQKIFEKLGYNILLEKNTNIFRKEIIEIINPDVNDPTNANTNAKNIVRDFEHWMAGIPGIPALTEIPDKTNHFYLGRIYIQLEKISNKTLYKFYLIDVTFEKYNNYVYDNTNWDMMQENINKDILLTNIQKYFSPQIPKKYIADNKLVKINEIMKYVNIYDTIDQSFKMSLTNHPKRVKHTLKVFFLLNIINNNALLIKNYTFFNDLNFKCDFYILLNEIVTAYKNDPDEFYNITSFYYVKRTNDWNYGNVKNNILDDIERLIKSNALPLPTQIESKLNVDVDFFKKYIEEYIPVDLSKIIIKASTKNDYDEILGQYVDEHNNPSALALKHLEIFNSQDVSDFERDNLKKYTLNDYIEINKFIYKFINEIPISDTENTQIFNMKKNLALLTIINKIYTKCNKQLPENQYIITYSAKPINFGLDKFNFKKYTSDYVKGEKYIFNHSYSTTLNYDVAHDFISPDRVMFIYIIPKNTHYVYVGTSNSIDIDRDINPISNISTESEIILPLGAEFTLINTFYGNFYGNLDGDLDGDKSHINYTYHLCLYHGFTNDPYEKFSSDIDRYITTYSGMRGDITELRITEVRKYFYDFIKKYRCETLQHFNQTQPVLNLTVEPKGINTEININDIDVPNMKKYLSANISPVFNIFMNKPNYTYIIPSGIEGTENYKFECYKFESNFILYSGRSKNNWDLRKKEIIDSTLERSTKPNNIWFSTYNIAFFYGSGIRDKRLDNIYVPRRCLNSTESPSTSGNTIYAYKFINENSRPLILFDHQNQNNYKELKRYLRDKYKHQQRKQEDLIIDYKESIGKNMHSRNNDLNPRTKNYIYRGKSLNLNYNSQNYGYFDINGNWVQDINTGDPIGMSKISIDTQTDTKILDLVCSLDQSENCEKIYGYLSKSAPSIRHFPNIFEDEIVIHSSAIDSLINDNRLIIDFDNPFTQQIVKKTNDERVTLFDDSKMNNNDHGQLTYECAVTTFTCRSSENIRAKIYNVYYNNIIVRKNIKPCRFMYNILSDFLFNSSIYNVPTNINYTELMNMYEKIMKMYKFEEEIYTLFNELINLQIYEYNVIVGGNVNRSGNVNRNVNRNANGNVNRNLSNRNLPNKNMLDNNNNFVTMYSQNYKEKYLKYKAKYLELKSKLN
jgi:hypothetical protein